jgi:hypothetical protein
MGYVASATTAIVSNVRPGSKIDVAFERPGTVCDKLYLIPIDRQQ